MKYIDKILKYLWLVNGIIFLIWAWYSIAPHIYRQFKEKPQPGQRGLIVGEKLEEAKGSGVELQAIKIERIIENQRNNYIIIPISQKDYAEPMRASDIQMDREAFSPPTYYTTFGSFNNLYFVKLDGSDKHLLLDKKALIITISIPREDIGNLIYYLVVDEDSNRDGRLDYSDHQNLYTSDLTGRNLNKFEIPVGKIRYSHVLKDTSDLILVMTKDIDQDGLYTEFDSDFVYKLNPQSKKIEEIVDTKLIDDIKKILFQ